MQLIDIFSLTCFLYMQHETITQLKHNKVSIHSYLDFATGTS